MFPPAGAFLSACEDIGAERGLIINDCLLQPLPQQQLLQAWSAAAIDDVCARRQADFAAGFKGGLSVTAILSDLLLFSCLVAFYTGIVLAIANLLS
jgi:hypothetical protein